MSMDMRAVPVERIQPNPWQTRQMVNDAWIRELADDIKQNGLLQVPLARVHPQDMEVVQLVFGHSRLAAWKLAKPGELFPVEVRPLTDREMADAAAAENAQRKDISPIEIAHAIRKRMDDFQLSQLEAGKAFGLKSQGAVSNLLRLLKLPGDIQPLVGAAGLPERHARGLIGLAKALPKEAKLVATRVAVAEAEQKDEVFDSLVGGVLRKHGRSMRGAPFQADTELPVVSQVVKTVQKFLGNIATLPVCAGCEYFVSREHRDACLRPGCYDVKVQVFAWQEVERLAKKHGVAPLNGEKTVAIFNGQNRRVDEAFAIKALATKHESLRLMVNCNTDHEGYTRERVLGSPYVELHMLDVAALKKAVAKLPLEKKQDVLAKGMDRVKREEKRLRERRDECRRLMRAAAAYLAKAFSLPEALLDLMLPTMSARHFAETSTQVEQRAKKADVAGKAQIMAEIVIAEAVDAGYMYDRATPETVIKKIEKLARELKVKLPAKWQEEV